MHYQSDAFAKSGKYTILSKIAPKVISRNLLITDTDASEIQKLYNCGAPIETTTTTKPTTTSRPTTATTTSRLTIQWNEELGNSWSLNCDFPGNDLKNVGLAPDVCAFECRITLGCTHYHWRNNFCFLKSNISITKANAVINNDQQTICGILTQG